MIRAIDNRNRTFVNGTQRYFAEVLANTLYKKLLGSDNSDASKAKNLTFDYFEVSSDGGSNSLSVPTVRKSLEKKYPELKKDSSAQKPYSHLIDAQMAFIIALSNHYKEGTFKINAKNISPCDSEYVDKDEEIKDIYKDTKISEEDFEKTLKRNRPSKDFFTHRQIHRDTFYSEKYLSIFVDKYKVNDDRNKQITVRIGFKHYDYDSYEYKLDIETIKFILQFHSKYNANEIEKVSSHYELLEYLQKNDFPSIRDYSSDPDPHDEYFCISFKC